MQIEVRPALTDDQHGALLRALADAGLGADETPAAYRSAWRRAAAEEAVSDEPFAEGYAPSPRSTRGATRA